MKHIDFTVPLPQCYDPEHLARQVATWPPGSRTSAPAGRSSSPPTKRPAKSVLASLATTPMIFGGSWRRASVSAPAWTGRSPLPALPAHRF